MLKRYFHKQFLTQRRKAPKAQKLIDTSLEPLAKLEALNLLRPEGPTYHSLGRSASEGLGNTG